MKRLLVSLLGLIMALTACGPKAPPTVDPTEVYRTAYVMARTAAAETLTAMPTNTSLPTDTPTASPTATQTPIPPTDTPTATLTPAPSSGQVAPNPNLKFNYGLLRFENNSGEEVQVILNCIDPQGYPIYYEYTFKSSMNIQASLGSYSYLVYVGKKRSFSGSFSISGPDKTTIKVFLNKVVISGP